jgi:hypothetical protein
MIDPVPWMGLVAGRNSGALRPLPDQVRVQAFPVAECGMPVLLDAVVRRRVEVVDQAGFEDVDPGWRRISPSSGRSSR